jgi:hypothetical protein
LRAQVRKSVQYYKQQSSILTRGFLRTFSYKYERLFLIFSHLKHKTIKDESITFFHTINNIISRFKIITRGNILFRDSYSKI